MSMSFSSYLSELDENSLLDLASLYLGRVQMPFSRAGITEALMHFFSSPAVKENLASGVSDDESMILSLRGRKTGSEFTVRLQSACKSLAVLPLAAE